MGFDVEPDGEGIVGAEPWRVVFKWFGFNFQHTAPAGQAGHVTEEDVSWFDPFVGQASLPYSEAGTRCPSGCESLPCFGSE